MTLHRRQLPIASPCQAFEGVAATDDTPAFCTRCDKHVHDLSRLSEPEVIGLLARHLDGQLCVSYRARTDGTIALRRPAPRLAPATFALSLAGCAGHLADDPADTKSCVDAGGYRIDCPPTARLGMAVIPDDVGTAIDPDHLDDGEVVEGGEGELEVEVEGQVMGGIPGGTVIAGDPPPLYPDVLAEPSEAIPTGQTYRGDVKLIGVLGPPNARLARKARREAKRIARRERRAAG